jgi:hypothetical protein
MTRRPYADTAASYRKAGWLGVLPLPANAKWWPPVGFTGRRDIDPDEVQVARWVIEKADGNIALRMPADVLGIDVDDYGDKPGGKTLADREAEWGELPQTWVVGSREGRSGIRFYRVPTQMFWPGQVGEGIETIHRGHRYAVVAPSVHPNGGVYRWIAPDGTEDGFTIPRPDDLAELPDAWVVGLSGGRFAKPASDKSDADPEEVRAALNDWATQGAPCRQVATRIGEATAILMGGGSRHDGIRDLTLNLVRLGQTGHNGVGWALEHVKEGFVKSISSTRGTEGEAAAEFQRLLLGGVLIVLADLRPHEKCEADSCQHDPLAGLAFDLGGRIIRDDVVEAPHVQAAPDVDSDALAVIEKEITRETLKYYVRQEASDRARKARSAQGLIFPDTTVDGAEYLALPDEETEWILNGLLPANGNATLTAQFKTGKTTLMGDLVAALSDRRPFLGRFKVKIDGRVGLFNYELAQSQQKKWLAGLGIERTDRFAVWDLRGYRLPLTSDAVEDVIVEWLKKREIEVWIIDPFARAFVGCGDENDNGDVSTFLDTIDVIKRRAGVSAVVMPVHTGRKEQIDGHEVARGATRLDDWPDVRWVLTKGQGRMSDTRYFRATGRDVDIDEESLSFDDQTRTLTIGGGDRHYDRQKAILDDVVKAITNEPGLSQNMILDVVEGRKTDVQKALVHAEERKLIVKKERSGRGGGYSYFPFEARYFVQPGG